MDGVKTLELIREMCQKQAIKLMDESEVDSELDCLGSVDEAYHSGVKQGIAEFATLILELLP